MGLRTRIHDILMPRRIMMKRLQPQILKIMLGVKQQTAVQISNYLWDKTLNCKESGVSDKKQCDEEVVVSLTSHGDRIYLAHLAIESIMQQTVKPNRIVLWLAEDEFKGKTLPVALQMQQERGLEIAYCENLKSYKKLIPSLKRFPESCIITIDDDLAYNPDLLEKLISAHNDCPSTICASRIHGMLLDGPGKLKAYKDWQLCIEKCPENNNMAFFTTGGGVLFPPHCFNDEVFNKDVFMDICETADDVWFNVMRLLSGVEVKKVFAIRPDGDFSVLLSSEINPLMLNNWRDYNDKAISAVLGRYSSFDILKNNKYNGHD